MPDYIINIILSSFVLGLVVWLIISKLLLRVKIKRDGIKDWAVVTGKLKGRNNSTFLLYTYAISMDSNQQSLQQKQQVSRRFFQSALEGSKVQIQYLPEKPEYSILVEDNYELYVGIVFIATVTVIWLLYMAVLSKR